MQGTMGLGKLPKKTLDLIDSVPVRLTADRAEIVLALANEKPATDLLLHVADIKKNKRETLLGKREIIKAVRALEELGLSVVLGKKYRVTPLRGRSASTAIFLPVYMGRDPQKAKQLSTLSPRSGNNDGYDFGLLNGYPRTAVKAYMDDDARVHGKRLLSWEEIRKLKLQERGWFGFLTFRLSRKHWRKEKERAKRWMRVIRTLHPALYSKITK